VILAAETHLDYGLANFVLGGAVVVMVLLLVCLTVWLMDFWKRQ